MGNGRCAGLSLCVRYTDLSVGKIGKATLSRFSVSSLPRKRGKPHSTSTLVRRVSSAAIM